MLVLAAPAAGQQAPRPLFPPRAPAEPASPAAAITVAPLPPPAAAPVGLATAEAALRGRLWPAGSPPDLPQLIARLPAAIEASVLRELQRNLLAAPAPAARGLLLARVDRLLAMAEPAAALEILALVPAGKQGPEIESQRLQAQLAGDRGGGGCVAAGAGTSPEPPWPQARLVCAALAGDPNAVELGLDLLASRGTPEDPDTAALLRAAAAGERVRVPAALPDEPLLWPLLRRMKLDLDADVVRGLSPGARRALLANGNLASAVRSAAAAPARPGPSPRPELNGVPPPDWAVAFDSVPVPLRAAWAALVDGLGLPLPDPLWARLATAPPAQPGPAPELALWRGFELARARDARGSMLLHALLLLDGRPEAAAPVTLRRALDALLSLGLVAEARALAADTGGALGL